MIGEKNPMVTLVYQMENTVDYIITWKEYENLQQTSRIRLKDICLILPLVPLQSHV
jgi:hypothetical protein